MNRIDFPLPPVGERKRPAWDATLGACVLTLPWAHPLWSQYMVGVIHLRPIEGVPEASITRQGATHEFVIYAIDPDDRVEPGRDFETRAPRLLSPGNIVWQFTAPDDAAALRVYERLVTAMLERRLSPDTDFRQAFLAYADQVAAEEAQRAAA